MGILFIDLGEVRTFQLKGAQTIGRESTNDIVVVHPTVSRHHARIEERDGRYVLTDFQSRNGTRVNGKAVEDVETLVDGARMRIGHVRAWFFTKMPSKLPRSITNRDRGVVFNCACGQRLWSASDTVGMTVTCGGCNQSIEVPDLSESTDDQSAGTVAGVEMSDGDEAKVPTCGVCQWPLERQERKHTCPSCGIEYHTDCWVENRGCATYGCGQVNALVARPAKVEAAAPAVRRPATPTLSRDSSVAVVDEVDEPEVEEETRPASRPTAPKAAPAAAGTAAFVLLALSVVGSLFGVLAFGVPAAIVGVISLVRLLVSKTDSKVALLAATLLAIAGAAAGYMISRFWWWGEQLF